MERGADVTIDELLRHRGWVHALARHLVHDDLEDVVQDVWVGAMERSPGRLDRPRAWLFKVLVNRARSRARADGRRRAREVAAGAWADRPATPEESASRTELHQMLAGFISELPEPYRHVVYLRYFEDREPSEIARLLDTPAGTVRWRLKEALTRLRARLDERHAGDRRIWVGLLQPIATPWPRRSTQRIPAWAGVGSMALLGLAAAGYLMIGDGGSRPPGEPLVGLHEDSARNEIPGAPQLPRLAAALPFAAEDRSCPGVEPIRAEVARLNRLLDPWRIPTEIFAEGEPNAILEARARPLFQELFRGAAQGCRHSVSCRATVCEITVLTPHGLSRSACQPRPMIKGLREYLSSGISSGGGSARPTFDHLEGKAYTTSRMIRRFHREDGRPVPRDQRPTLPKARVDLGSPRPPRPDGLSKVCSAQWERQSRDLDRLEDWITNIFAHDVFEASRANVALTGRIKVWAGKVLGRSPSELPLEVSCRARVCRLSPQARVDAGGTGWNCPELHGQARAACAPDAGDADWYQAIRKNARSLGRLEEPARDRDGFKPAYLIVPRAAEDERPSPWKAVVAFMDSFDWRGGLLACEARHPDRGTLIVMLHVPETTGLETPVNRPSLHVGGPMAGTRLGRCVVDLFTSAAALFTTPAVKGGAVFRMDLEFPFDASLLEAKLERTRRRYEVEEAMPGLAP